MHGLGRSLDMFRRFVHGDFGRAKHLTALPIAALEDLKNGVGGLRRVMALRNRFVTPRVKNLTQAFFRLDAMLAQ